MMINSLAQGSSYNFLKADIIITLIEEILLKNRFLKIKNYNIFIH
jgi:hypothetical protein